MEYTHHFKPDSTSIIQAWYDRETERLALEFHSGTIVGYEGITFQEWIDLANASSTGRFYAYNIRGQRKGFRVNEAPTHRPEPNVTQEREFDVPKAPAVGQPKFVVTYVTEKTITITGDSAEQVKEAVENSYNAKVTKLEWLIDA